MHAPFRVDTKNATVELARRMRHCDQRARTRLRTKAALGAAVVLPETAAAVVHRAVDAIRSALPAGMKRWMALESLHDAPGPDEGFGLARTLGDAIADAESRGEPEQLDSVEDVAVSSTTTASIVRRSIPTTIVYRVRWNALALCVIPANVLHFVDDAANVVCDQHGTPLDLGTEPPSFYLIGHGVEINDNGSVPLTMNSSSDLPPNSVGSYLSSPRGPPAARPIETPPYSSTLDTFTGASVLVVCGDGYLLGRSKFDGFWHDFGGQRNDDETPIRTAERELREETGLKLASLDLANLHPVVVEHKGNVHAVFVAIMPDAVRSSASFDANADGVICGENIGDGELTAFAVCRDFGSFFESDLPARQAAHRRFHDVRVMALAAHAFHVANKHREKRVIRVGQADATVADSLRASAAEYAPPARPGEGVVDCGYDAVNLAKKIR